jgi:hypothetical protein
MIGPKWKEVTGEWRILHNEELHALYSSPNIILVINSRRLSWAGQLARMREIKSACSILIRKPEGRRQLETPRRSREDNIKMNLREAGCRHALN